MAEAHEHNGAVGEEVTGMPVLAPTGRAPTEYGLGPGPLVPSGAPSARATALAVTGFVAGAATVVLLHRRRVRRALEAKALARSFGRRGRRAAKQGKGVNELVQIVASRSLLVDVHLLGGRD